MPEPIITGQLSAWSHFISEVVFFARATARSKGYALAVHGSLFRDLDVVAVPWTDAACSAQELAEALCDTLVRCEVAFGWTSDCADGQGHEKPLGRTSWSITLSRHDGPAYLDLSVAPRVPAGAQAIKAERARIHRALLELATKDHAWWARINDGVLLEALIHNVDLGG